MTKIIQGDFGGHKPSERPITDQIAALIDKMRLEQGETATSLFLLQQALRVRRETTEDLVMRRGITDDAG